MDSKHQSPPEVPQICPDQATGQASPDPACLSQARPEQQRFEKPLPKKRPINTSVLPSSLGRIPPLVRYVLARALRVNKLQEIYYSIPETDGPQDFAQKSLEALGVTVEIEGGLENIPASGPLVIAANHPFGALEGIVMAQTFLKARPDLRIMANFMLGIFPDLAPAFISVDPFGGAERRNITGLREARDHLAAGGALGMFPAGTVSHWQRGAGITDPAWNSTVARIAQKTNATVLPIYFHGQNSVKFNLAGMIHPAARTILLPSELLNKRGTTVRISIGTPVMANTLRVLGSAESATEYLRMRCYDLKPTRKRHLPPDSRPMLPLPPAMDGRELQAELDSLPEECLYVDASGYQVYSVKRSQAPKLIEELGRVRELTFREVGEGSGFERDLDKYDDWYQHLILWHKEKACIAGAYRLGLSKEILPVHGPEGFYVSSLFHFQPEFFKRYSGSMELGRAMVTQEFQKDYAPLHLLWKGIAQTLVRNHELRYFFGPTSLSLDLRPTTLRTIVSYLKQHHGSAEIARLVSGREVPEKLMKPGSESRLARGLNYNAVSALVRDMEGGRSIPVLFKHYLRLAGRIGAFHADFAFNTLDAFLFMDLTETPRSTLSRYLEDDELQAFIDRHTEPRKN